MDELLNAIATLVALVPSEKLSAVAERARRTEADKAAVVLCSVVGTPTATAVVEQLAIAWQNTKIGPDELASMLIAAGYVYKNLASKQSVELVWTGPTTPFVSARRTEQALLQVINAAQKNLFITSFVAYDISNIVSALKAATERNVSIAMLLESSQDHGGSINIDVIGRMRALIPVARLYAWRGKVGEYADGRVHAKVAVADDQYCFITSANLTGHAMEKNMEAGVLITGGHMPKLLYDHLSSLIDTNIIELV